jgi:class 3 adenylate cyclase
MPSIALRPTAPTADHFLPRPLHSCASASVSNLHQLDGRDQNSMIERNAGLPPERRIEFRIGIHLGDVVEE